MIANIGHPYIFNLSFYRAVLYTALTIWSKISVRRHMLVSIIISLTCPAYSQISVAIIDRGVGKGDMSAPEIPNAEKNVYYWVKIVLTLKHCDSSLFQMCMFYSIKVLLSMPVTSCTTKRILSNCVC